MATGRDAPSETIEAPVSVHALAASLKGTLRLSPPSLAPKKVLGLVAEADESSTDDGVVLPPSEAARPVMVRRQSALAANGINIGRELRIEQRRKEFAESNGSLRSSCEARRDMEWVKHTLRKTSTPPPTELEARLLQRRASADADVGVSRVANASEGTELSRAFEKRRQSTTALLK